MRAAVLRPRALRRARIERKLLAVAHRAHAVGRDAERDQIVVRRQRAPLAERQVVFGRAALVAVALDRDLPRRYFFSTAAFSCSTCWPSALTSELSSSKNTGWSGESRLRSSSDFEPIGVLGAASGGTGTGSVTGSAAAAAPAAVVVATAGGGGIGRATGGLLLRARGHDHRQQDDQNQSAPLACLVSSHQTFSRTVVEPRNRSGTVALYCDQCGVVVVAVARDLPHVPAVAIDGEDLAAAGARRRERQVAAVGRPRRALVAAFAERDLPRLAGGDRQNLDVVAGPGARRERDLVVRRRRPGRRDRRTTPSVIRRRPSRRRRRRRSAARRCDPR